MFLGNFNGNACVTSINSPNSSICVTGLSGTGKTSRLNQIELDGVKKGATVLVLDVNQAHTDERIFPYIREEYLNRVNRIHAVRDGLGLSLLHPIRNPQGEEESFVHLVNSAVQALSSSQRMGVRQIGSLRKAVINAINHPNVFKNEEEALALSLLQQEDVNAEAVYQKLWTLLNCGALKPSSKCIQSGYINIIDFSGLDMFAQTSLSEIVLSNLWRRAQYGTLQADSSDLIIFLDEFQNLSLKSDAILRSMLREGRKFGISLVLATQTLDVFPRDIISVLNQTATKLYFKPSQNEARRVAKEIGQYNIADWIKTILSLRVGECIAVGDLCVDGVEIRRPLLLK